MLKFDDYSKKINEAKREVAPTEWDRKNSTSLMKMIYPPKPGSLTEQFIEFIFEKPGSTVKEFYAWLDREYTAGNNSLFFATMNQSGIMELVGSKYYFGPNYGKWTQGLLKPKSTRTGFRGPFGGGDGK